MGTIIEPTQPQLDKLVAPYLATQPSGLGFAIGYASPQFSGNNGSLYFAGNVQNQFGTPLNVDGETPFEIASVSKTFTATLYALLIRASSATQTINDYIPPNGPLGINPSLANITLDELMNYRSGLPTDNATDQFDSPPYLPQPYTMPAMMSYLNTAPPALSSGFSYSNLSFAIMSAILASGPNNGPARVGPYEMLMYENIFLPLLMGSRFFDTTSLARLPLGYNYDYTQSTAYTQSPPGWVLFPAYFGAGGIVASPNDMFQWLLFNMGILNNATLTPLLPVLQNPSTDNVWENYRCKTGLGWFISLNPQGSAASIWKDGDLDGFSSYIAFLPSENPGVTASQAGAFVLVNADGATDNQTNSGLEIAAALTNDLLLIMQGQTPPLDKSSYPRTALSRRQRRPVQRLIVP